jgi:2-methylisocitrate lyase-like PEP mutase family enzyme
MSRTQIEKALQFRALHEGAAAFVIPNPWDVGSARMLEGLGYKALATSSAAAAISLGKHDGGITRADALAHAASLVSASNLPVSADLENGFSDDPSQVAEVIRLAAGVGLVGGSIEDASSDRSRGLYDLGHAVERVRAAVEAARSLPFPFTLTARAENFVRGSTDLDDTIRRLQAYEAAGADVLFAPGLPSLDAVRAVCAAVNKPVNFMAGLAGKSFSVAELTAAGVRRISLGASLHKAAMQSFLSAAREIQERGTFGYAATLPGLPDLYRLMDGVR